MNMCYPSLFLSFFDVAFGSTLFLGRGQRGFLTRIFEAETESIDNFGDNFFPASNTNE